LDVKSFNQTLTQMAGLYMLCKALKFDAQCDALLEFVYEGINSPT